MAPAGITTRSHRLRRLAVAAAGVVLAASCGGRTPSSPTAPSPTATSVPIMGASRLGATQIVAWFNGRQPRPSGLYAATVPVETLAQICVEEGQ